MLWFMVFVLWSLAELFVIVEVARAIGVFWMLLALIITWPIGTRILRTQGRRALWRLSNALAQGRAPAAEVVDGALALTGGLLLIVPGFIADAIGLLLMVPFVRRLAGRRAANHVANGPLRRIVNFGARATYDAESTATDIDQAQLHR
jgi:UPF0716 protein FxsA